MSDAAEVGKNGWIDLTVEDAAGLRDFFAAVTGWEPGNVDMGDYPDFCMMRPDGEEPAAGTCHARGDNAAITAQSLIYIAVPGVDDSATTCTDNGGEVIAGPKPLGDDRFAAIRDPGGATAALYQAS